MQIFAMPSRCEPARHSNHRWSPVDTLHHCYIGLVFVR
jgi:hypothetical protein